MPSLYSFVLYLRKTSAGQLSIAKNAASNIHIRVFHPTSLCGLLMSSSLSFMLVLSFASTVTTALSVDQTATNISGSRWSIPIFFDSSNEWHRDMQYHPEQPARVEACVKALANHHHLKDHVKLIDVMDEPIIQGGTPITRILVPQGGDDEEGDNPLHHEHFSTTELQHARDMLVLAHSEEFVTQLEKRCRNARQRRIDDGKTPLGFVGYTDEDTFLTTESFDVCLRAAAAWIRAVDVALEVQDPKSQKPLTLGSPAPVASMALTRPPGHHATTNLSNGFCPLNFAAAAVIHAMESNPTLKVSVFDWDVHFGQGVMDILQRYQRARYVSIHQSPAFPYEGSKKQIHGKYQNILTLPIVADTTWTCGYQTVFEEEALPFLIPNQNNNDDNDGEARWDPDLLLICAGYDALTSDELASVNLQAKDYGVMTRKLIQRFHTAHPGKQPAIAFGLEGGYQLSSMPGGGNLPDAVVETIQALLPTE